MLTTVYKNHNVRIRRDPGFDRKAPSNLARLLEDMQNDIDAPDVWNIEECYPTPS